MSFYISRASKRISLESTVIAIGSTIEECIQKTEIALAKPEFYNTVNRRWISIEKCENVANRMGLEEVWMDSNRQEIPVNPATVQEANRIKAETIKKIKKERKKAILKSIAFGAVYLISGIAIILSCNGVMSIIFGGILSSLGLTAIISSFYTFRD